jgi:alkanesulfonate monooxygenase SsuD/methylene tetrahydromethanopterin reductase-like flavin-dependent oxidoreductase (luciferase family)
MGARFGEAGAAYRRTRWDGGPPRLGAKLAEIAQAADEAGFDLISVADHLWQHPIETVFGWVVDVDRITPIEIMGREVIPAATELVPA